MPQKPELTIGVDGRELLPGRTTGVGRYLRNFLESQTVRNAPHCFVVYGNQHTAPAAWGPNVRFTVFPESSTLLWDHRVLGRACRTDRLDVFFSPYDKIPARAACPAVPTVHDLLFLAVRDTSPWRHAAYKLWYLTTRRWMLRRAPCVLTVSAHARRDIRTRLSIPASRIRVVYNGIHPRYGPAPDPGDDARALTRYGLVCPYVLYVGNFKPHKNLRVLLHAYAGLAEPLRTRAALVLAGTPDAHQPALEACADHLGLAGRVRFPGTVAEEDLPAVYRQARCLVQPSLYEGFGLPALEAMACGTPVVVSNVTSLPEVVGDAGLLVDPRAPEALRDALETLLTRDDVHAACARAGRDRARRFSVEAFATRILTALEQAAGRRP